MPTNTRIRVGWQASVGLTGDVLAALPVPLAFPLLIAIYYGESPLPFLADRGLARARGGVPAGAGPVGGPRAA